MRRWDALRAERNYQEDGLWFLCVLRSLWCVVTNRAKRSQRRGLIQFLSANIVNINCWFRLDVNVSIWNSRMCYDQRNQFNVMLRLIKTVFGVLRNHLTDQKHFWISFANKRLGLPEFSTLCPIGSAWHRSSRPAASAALQRICFACKVSVSWLIKPISNR